MGRMKLATIKTMVQTGQAVCINNAHDRSAIKGNYDEIGYSIGVQGVNGKLFKSEEGKFYAITCRCMALDIF